MQVSIPHLSPTTYQYPGKGPWKTDIERASPCVPFHPHALSGAAGPASTPKEEMKAVDPKGHSATELREDRPNSTFVGDPHQ